MRPSVLAASLFPCGLAALAAFAACGGTTVSGGSTNPLDSNEPATSSADPASGSSEGADSGTETPGAAGEPNGNTTGTSPLNAFLACFDSQVPPACISCVEEGCAADLRALVAACGPVLDCLATCNCDDTCFSACATSFATAECNQVATHLGKCSPTECVSVCGGSSSTISIGGSEDGGTVTLPGSGNGTGVTSGGGCSALSTCCSSLPSEEQQGCNDVVSTNNTTDCSSTLSGYQSEGICN